MRLKVKVLRFMTGRPIAVLNHSTANHINVHIGERIELSKYADSIVSIVDVSRDLIGRDEVAVSQEILESLNIKENDEVEVSLANKPQSTFFIKKKMDGGTLTKEEIHTIIKDVVDNALTEAEIAYFVAAVYKNKMINSETEALISAMVSSGKRLSFEGVVVDKHSIGGIAANRTTPIVVSICASAGLTMPKTSSRAITSAAGTADVMESIAKVEFNTDELKAVVKKTGACLAWNGILGLSPADDKLIQTERILGLDPEAQLLASVLSKKIAVGSKHVLIDIPFGTSAKVTKEKALDLKKKFEYFGKRFGLNLRCVLTDGSQPIGNGIGPLLEIKDVIKVLKQEKDCPKDLEKKSVFLAGEILELCGKVKKGKGESLAREILVSGRAMHKFKEIIEAQSGKVPNLEEIDSRVGKLKKNILAENNFKLKIIDNKSMNTIASVAGSPMDKGSGIYLYHHIGDKVKKGDKLMTIYSDSKTRLSNALDLCEKLEPIK